MGRRERELGDVDEVDIRAILCFIWVCWYIFPGMGDRRRNGFRKQLREDRAISRIIRADRQTDRQKIKKQATS